MPTLILPPRYTEDTNLVRKAAIARGWRVERLTSWRVPQKLTSNLKGCDPVLYGEPLFAAVVADELGLQLIEAPLNWLTTLPDSLLGRQVQFMPLAEARKIGDRKFIKPASDKCFVAQVYESGTELPTDDILPNDTPTLVSEPVVWEIEIRCFVQSRQVVTMSPYLRYGNLVQTEQGNWPAQEYELVQAATFIKQVLNTDIDIPTATVIDIGIVEGFGWAVVEANAAWGSGIYGCDPHRVLSVVKSACVSN